MHVEYLDYINLTREKIKKTIESTTQDELTCLVAKDDEQTSTLLRETDFRYVGKRRVKGSVMAVFKWFRDVGKYEDMGSFFDRRVRDYDLHMADSTDSYEPTFVRLFQDVPETQAVIAVLDLGCGTGAELKYLFQRASNARVVGIDVSEGMLQQLRASYVSYAGNIETVSGSYLETDLGKGQYDYAIGCSTLHHMLAEDKLELYAKVKTALKEDGYFLISDYFAENTEAEQAARANYLRLLAAGAIHKDQIYHIDLPLTMEHEVELLRRAGFTVTRIERTGENGGIMVARK